MDVSVERKVPTLFERLSDRIFSPLASTNRLQYWCLLRALYRHRFGPDAPLPPSEGFARNDLTREVQAFLTYSDTWVNEEGDDLATPNEIRAQMVLNRLIDAGWLRVDRYGLDKRVSMAPTVSHFLSLLVDFSESEPVFLGGKIRSIEANINGVLAGGHGDQLAEAAEQTRYLLEHVRNTGTNVRDVMDRLTPDLTTREFARYFFNDFVSRIFIGDYRELRTTEHPLSRRSHILEAVERIYDTPNLHSRVLDWYCNHRCAGDGKRGEALLRRDFDRLRDLARIDEYLLRLDREVTRANKRALAFLDYRMRSLQPLDTLIERTILAVLEAGMECRTQFPAGPLIGELYLRLPRVRTERPTASRLRRNVPSDEQIARARLMQRMQDARDVDPHRLATFIDTRCANTDEVSSAALAPREPFELFAYQRLIDLAQANGTRSLRLRHLARLDLPGFDVLWSDDAPEEDEPLFLKAPPFVVRRRKSSGERT